jgi:capsular polysaccharide biosynthesis protein
MTKGRDLRSRLDANLGLGHPFSNHLIDLLIGGGRQEAEQGTVTGCRYFDYAPGQPNLYRLMRFKQALVEELGLEAGFDFYANALGLRSDAALSRKFFRSERHFAETQGLSFVETAPAGIPFAHDPPLVIGQGNHKRISGLTRAEYVACVPEARVRGRSALINVEEALLLDCQDAEQGRLDDELEWDSAVFSANGTDVWSMPATEATPHLHLPRAFSLLGAHTDFFGHWMSEYLTKYLAAEISGLMPKVPVLIDAHMPASHRQALELFSPDATEIIEVPAFSEVHVQELWCAPTLMYMPLHEKQNERFGWDAIAASPNQFAPVIRRMASWADLRLAKPDRSPSRIFLARKSFRHRKLVNSTQIEALAVAQGFEIVYPEDFSFAEQILLVRNAKHIVALEGSAIFLAYLASAGARLCILSHPLTDALAEYNGVLSLGGVATTALSGPITRANIATPHDSDYEIEAGLFSSFLLDWLSPSTDRTT